MRELMNSLGLDAISRIEKFDEAQADRARARGVVAAREVEVMMMFDLGACDDLVENVAFADVLEVDRDDRPERRRIAHFDEQATGGDVAGDRERVAVELAPDHDQEGLIEAGMDALLTNSEGRHGAAFFEDVSEVGEGAALHRNNDRAPTSWSQKSHFVLHGSTRPIKLAL